MLAFAALARFFTQAGPQEILRNVPLPGWVESIAQNDSVAYKAHVAFGGLFELVGAPPVATASEWFKATWHAKSYSELDAAARGLVAVSRRADAALLESSLCPFVSEWSDTQAWGPRGRQLAVLGWADLSCGEARPVFGAVPDDVPLVYADNPPHSGLYLESFVPMYGVTNEPVPPGFWVHNLAHGEVVLLHSCAPDDCPNLLHQARELHATLPPGRNARGGPARFIVTRYAGMGHPLAVVAWGHVLPLQQFDADRIMAFYIDHVDQGIECRNLVC